MDCPVRPRFLLNAKVSESTLCHFRLPGGMQAKTRTLIREWLNIGWDCRTDVDCPHHFEIVIRPWMITHQRANLPELEARLDEIFFYFENDAGWEKLDRLFGRRTRCWKDQALTPLRRAVDKLHARDMREAQFNFNNPQPPPGVNSFSRFQKTQGTTRIVPFDFPDPSFSTHFPTAA